MTLPEGLRRTVAGTFGAAGRQWLADFPRLLATAQERWQLTRIRPFENLNYNFVARAQRADGEQVVLKAGVPSHELRSEITALGFYDGRGAVRLLDADPETGLLLLQALEGETLLPLYLADDEAATRAAALVMRHLWRPAPQQSGLPSVATWGRGFARLRARFDGATGPFPAQLVARAAAIYDGYLAAPQTAVLLHGDLHHMNILAHGEAWLAIDPKGLIGEAAYETGALLRNPLPQMLHRSDAGIVVERRVAILAEMLDLERERIRNWAFAQAVLSAWWNYEDNDPAWAAMLPLAEVMASLL